MQVACASVVEKQAPVPKALKNGGEAKPMRAWLSSWNCATHTYISVILPHRVHLAWWFSRTVYVPGGLEFEP